MTEPHHGAILRVVPGPSDINANGHIFGGWVLSQMDIAAGIVASRRANGSVATIAIDKMEFLAPIHLRDLISVYASVERVGRTSMAIRIEVIATRDRGDGGREGDRGGVHLRRAGRGAPAETGRCGDLIWLNCRCSGGSASGSRWQGS